MITGIQDLIAYLRRFHGSWTDVPGLNAERIPLDLPPGLASLYRELGALIELKPTRHEHRTPFAAQHALMPLDRLKRVDGMVEFAWENQGNWSCRCAPGMVDPPVYSNASDVWETERKGFQKVCDSLDHFLVTLSLQEAVMSAPVLLALEAESFDAALTMPVEPLWREGWYVQGEPTHNFYVVPGQDLLLMDYAGLWAGSHDARAVSLFRSSQQINRLH